MPPASHWPLAFALAFIATTPAFAGVEDGVTKWRAGDYTGAVAEWREPAASGNRDALFNLGQAYKLGRGVPVDMNKAAELYRQAATKGHQTAEANLGWVLFQQGKREEALPLLHRAASRGDAHSQYLLGIAYFNGDIVQKDSARAYRLMTAAAASGMPQARDALGAMDSRIPLAERQKALATADTMKAAKSPTLSRPATAPVQQPAQPKTSATTPMRAVNMASIAPVSTPAPAPVAAKPPAPVAAKSPAPAAETGKWRVQLGAFSNQKSAAAAWDRLSAKTDALGKLSPIYTSSGQFVRLQAGPITDRASANAICTKITASGAACFPVQP